MMYENLVLIYVVVAVLAFIVIYLRQYNFSNSLKMKGRYMLLGSILWPFVIVDGVLAIVFIEIGKTVKENLGRILSVLFFIFPFLKDGLYHYFDMCYFCFALPVELKHEVKCTIAGHVGEEVSTCTCCGNQFDYFSYGSTEREYYQGIFESEYPSLSTLLNKIAEFTNHAGTLYNRG